MRKLRTLSAVIGLDYRHYDFTCLHQSVCCSEVCFDNITKHKSLCIYAAVTAVSRSLSLLWLLMLSVLILLNHRQRSETFISLWTDNLLIDYQFTFSLIQEDDNHYTAINFMASPEQVRIEKRRWVRLFRDILLWGQPCFCCVPLKPNKNLDMSINASNNFNLNITWSVGSTGNFSLCFLWSKDILWIPCLFWTRKKEKRREKTLTKRNMLLNKSNERTQKNSGVQRQLVYLEATREKASPAQLPVPSQEVLESLTFTGTWKNPKSSFWECRIWIYWVWPERLKYCSKA